MNMIDLECPRCGQGKSEDDVLCAECRDQFDIEMQESMRHMFDDEGNNL